MEHNSDPISSIGESQATGRTAQIFSELRDRIGIRQVNLIWRALAVDEDALEWTWLRLRPLYERGLIWGAAAKLEAALSDFRTDDTALIGLAQDQRQSLDSLLETYLRANCTNYLGLLALSEQEGYSQPVSLTPASAPAPIDYSPPPLLDMSEMSGRLRACVQACNRLGTDESTPMLASAWRQLAHWPEFLEAYLAMMAPRHEDRSVFEQIALLERQAGDLAMGLRNYLSTTSRAPERFTELAAYFTSAALPRMLVLLSFARSLVDKQSGKETSR